MLTHGYRRNPGVEAIGRAVVGALSHGRGSYRTAAQLSEQLDRLRSRTKPRYRKKEKKREAPRALSRKVNRLSNQIKDVRCKQNVSTSKHIYRLIQADAHLVAVNSQAIATKVGCSISTIEASLANLEYYDPSNPTVLVTADFSSGDFNKTVCFRNWSSKIELRNNYQVDANVRLYLCMVRDDTDQNPNNSFSAGATDAGVTSTTIGAYPTDFPVFNATWKTKLCYSGIIKAGQSVRKSHNTGKFTYNPAVVDTQNQAYQRDYKSFAWMVIISGTVGHDTGQDEQGLLQAGLDIVTTRSAEIEYDSGGSNLVRCHLDTSGLSTFTNVDPVQGLKPIADLQAYATN